MIRLFDFVKIPGNAHVTDIAGLYVALGNFDYMSTWSQNWSEKEQIDIISDPTCWTFNNRKIGGEHSYTVGFRADEYRETDERFWNNHGFPYIFISSLKFKNRKNLKNISSYIEAKINERTDCLLTVYSTLDESDLLICLRTETYNNGYKSIMRYNDIAVKKDREMNVISGITTVLLDPQYNGDENSEFPEFILRCEVINRDLFNNFLEILKVSFPGAEIEKSGIFGVDDRIIRICGAMSKDWRSFYVGKEAVSKTEKLKKCGIQNLKTEIFEGKQKIQ